MEKLARRNKAGFYQSEYIVVNTEKYRGKQNPKCRSSWEHRFCFFLDHTPQVKWWDYECLTIEYYSPIDQKIHRYFPDFLFNEEDNSGKSRTFLIEVKPQSQIKPPKESKSSRGRRTYIYEAKTFVINRLKWEAAEIYCKKNNYEFKIVSLVKQKGNEIWKAVSLSQI